MITKNSKIFLAGHNGMIGSAIYRKLKKSYKKIITIEKKKLDLRDQIKVFNFLKKIKPHVTIVAAAKVGGIKANNDFKADFIYDNLSIQNNLIHGSFLSGTKNLIFLGSSCVYPKNSKQPIKEKSLLSSYLEKTNEPYAIAKIAGIKLCESYNHQYKLNYKCLMPSNSYGLNDNYDSKSSHFLPAIIKKIIEAIKNGENFITLWGNGTPLRELIFSDDVADAVLYFMNKKTDEALINIGSKDEKSINDFAKLVMKVLGVDLKIKYINKNFNGTLRKKLDLTIASKYGWRAKTPIKKALLLTINDYLEKKLKKLS
ncbi:NAD-dependent epimerase/dehydratase family protein [Candidatus Pelagibacter sp.]|nr:NAD-dependent epimerase/dehydratase family protein [Candidatus Pelagibacter sp.]